MNKSKKPTNNIAIISFTDLYAMYKFTNEEIGYPAKCGPEARKVILQRRARIEQELYERTYGFNPHTLDAIVVEGQKPEDIDLSKFDRKE